jgi:hypothetical protein
MSENEQLHILLSPCQPILSCPQEDIIEVDGGYGESEKSCLTARGVSGTFALTSLEGFWHPTDSIHKIERQWKVEANVELDNEPPTMS